MGLEWYRESESGIERESRERERGLRVGVTGGIQKI